MKRYHVSKNLVYSSETQTTDTGISVSQIIGSTEYTLNKSVTSSAVSAATYCDMTLPAGTYTITVNGINEITSDNTYDRVFIRDSGTNIVVQDIHNNIPKSFTLNASTTLSKIIFVAHASSVYSNKKVTIMLNTGSTPLPYEPYGNTWQTKSPPKYGTSTDTITTLPADLYADGNNATVGLKGNMEQSGTPTPTTPIQPSKCGDLETTGEHTGQYKIPISSANTTTPVYLGEVQTTRKIKKLVLTGEESWNKSSTYQGSFYARVIENPYAEGGVNTFPAYCSHAEKVNRIDSSTYTYGKFAFDGGTSPYNLNLFIGEASWSKDDFKAYLAAQYAAGTPVCVWYVLATPTTGIVNEPLRKIGDYADTVSDVSIPTTTGKDTFDVLTTLKPSEVSLAYTGWHDATVKEWDGSEWQ